MFLTVRLSIIRSLFTVHSAVVYVIQVCRQLSSQSGSWWWTDELSETCRVSCQNEFVKLVHLFGFIIRKFVTMHGHMNVLSRCTVTWTYCKDARSREGIVTMHGHMNVLLRWTVTWTYCHDARSHELTVMMHGHMNVLLRCTVTWTYCHDARSHELTVAMDGHMNVLSRCTVTWTYCYDGRSHERIVTIHGHMNEKFLKWILKNQAGRAWIGLIWLSTGTCYCEGGQRASGFHKMGGISWLDEPLLARHTRLRSCSYLDSPCTVFAAKSLKPRTVS
jgi:hypothetical protein